MLVLLVTTTCQLLYICSEQYCRNMVYKVTATILINYKLLTLYIRKLSYSPWWLLWSAHVLGYKQRYTMYMCILCQYSTLVHIYIIIRYHSKTMSLSLTLYQVCSIQVDQATCGSLCKFKHFCALYLTIKHRVWKRPNLHKLPEVVQNWFKCYMFDRKRTRVTLSLSSTMHTNVYYISAEKREYFKLL